MLQAANSIFSAHFAVLTAKRSVLERAVAACSDYNSSSFKVPVWNFSLYLNKIEEMYGRSRVNEKVEPPSCLRVAINTLPRTHVEIKPQRKSILTFDVSSYRKQFLHWIFRFYKGVGFWQWSTLQEVPGWTDKEAAWGHYNRSGLSHDVWQEVSLGFIVGEED